MLDFNKGVSVSYARTHDVTFVPGAGQLSETLTLDATSKVKSMTLFTNFVLLETKSGITMAIPVSNFKNIVIPKDATNNKAKSN